MRSGSQSRYQGTDLSADAAKIQVQHFVDESSERRHVGELAVPKSGEVLDDVMHVRRLRHLLVIRIRTI